MSKSHTPTPIIRSLAELLVALDELDKVHVCRFEIVRGSGLLGQTAEWKCRCGKTVRSN